MFFFIAHQMSRKDPDMVESIINRPPESGSVIQDYGPVVPDPIENISGSTTLKMSQLAPLC